ncbi:MAG TPA: hypothetical protein PLI30_01655 [Petrimonas sp.]|nr:hypothetical protein [Petrimonas sp.]
MRVENVFKKCFIHIIDDLKAQGNNLTSISKSMGYTSTSQLHNAMSEDGLPSTKAIIALIENYKVNPSYLFLNQGDIYSDESELERVKTELSKYTQMHNEAVKTVNSLNEMVKTLEQRNADLIDITADALKFHKQSKGDIEPRNEK